MDENVKEDGIIKGMQPESQEASPELSWQDETTAATAENASEVATEATETAEIATANGSEVAGDTDTNDSEASTSDATSTSFFASDMGTTGTTGAAGAAAVVTTPAKKTTGLFILIGVLVLGIIALVVKLAFFTETPEEAVQKALDKSNTVMIERADKMASEIPALDKMSKMPGSATSDFKLSFEGMNIADADMQVQMVASLFKGAYIGVNSVNDFENQLNEFEMSVGLADTKLMDMYMLLSPEKFAFGMPQVSETLFALNPKTMKTDFKASPLYTNMIESYATYGPEVAQQIEAEMETQLTQLQESLDGMFGSVNGLGILDQEKLQTELTTRLNLIFTDAVYKKLSNNGGNKVYQVDLSGSQVKQTLIDLARYVYMESEVADMYDGMFAGMVSDMSYSQMMEQQIIVPMEANLPNLPTTIVFEVDNKKVIRSAKITMNPEMEAPAEGAEVINFDKFDIGYSYGSDETIGVTTDIAIDEGQLGMTNLVVKIEETYADGASNMTMDMDISTQIPGNTDASSTNVNMLLATDKTGKCDITFVVDNNGYYGSKITMAASGGVAEDQGTSTWNYPSINFAVEELVDGGELKPLGDITFALTNASTPLVDGYTPTRVTTPIFEMAQDKLDVEMKKYEDAFSSIIQQVSSMMGIPSGMPSAGTPEDGVSDPAMQAPVAMSPEDEAIEAYFNNLSPEEFEAHMNMSEDELAAKIDEVIAQAQLTAA